MNWVGGSRTRILIKQERRKQKEYFEKKRLKSKMRLLGVLSPVKNSVVSLDLLNLYMVNQISCQRKLPETVRKPIHVNMNKDIKMPVRKQDLELPMSPPCRPSNLCIDDLENNIHYQMLGCKGQHDPVQFSNVNYSDSLTSKLHDNRDISSSSYKTMQSGTSFERLNSPGNRNLPGRPSVVTSEDDGGLEERRQSDFISDKKPSQCVWADNAKDAPSFLDYVNQPTPSLLSINCDSFINPNMIDLLNVDQQTVKKTFDCMGGIHAAVSCDSNHPTDWCSSSVFTEPELTFSTSAPNETSCPEKCWLNRNYQKEYSYNKGNHCGTFLQKDCYPTNSEKKGIFGNDCQEKMPQKKIQKYPLQCMGKSPLEELNPRHSWDIGLGDTVMGGHMCSLKDRPASKEIGPYLGSPQSSQSVSYSPRQTDSNFSSSSDMPSEDEDSVLQQMEEPERSIKAKETSNNVYLERPLRLPGEKESGDGARCHQQNDHFHQFSVKNNPSHFSQSQSYSAHVLQEESIQEFLPQGARHKAGVQTKTEGWPVGAEKADVAVQCGGLSLCPCDAGTQTQGWPAGAEKADVAVQCGVLSLCPCEGIQTRSGQESSGVRKAGSPSEYSASTLKSQPEM